MAGNHHHTGIDSWHTDPDLGSSFKDSDDNEKTSVQVTKRITNARKRKSCDLRVIDKP